MLAASVTLSRYSEINQILKRLSTEVAHLCALELIFWLQVISPSGTFSRLIIKCAFYMSRIILVS